MVGAEPMRLVIVGAAGSGKTTLARALAESTGVRTVDIDELFWDPGWQQVDADTLRARLATVVDQDEWIVSGNYTAHVRELLWPRADALVWLDLPRRVSFRRVVVRTVGDLFRRRELFPGCPQTLAAPFSNHLFHIAWRQPAKYAARYETYLDEPASAHLKVSRLRTPRQVAEWLTRACSEG
jgi:adenylate kinase family enzyme